MTHISFSEYSMFKFYSQNSEYTETRLSPEQVAEFSALTDLIVQEANFIENESEKAIIFRDQGGELFKAQLLRGGRLKIRKIKECLGSGNVKKYKVRFRKLQQAIPRLKATSRNLKKRRQLCLRKRESFKSFASQFNENRDAGSSSEDRSFTSPTDAAFIMPRHIKRSVDYMDIEKERGIWESRMEELEKKWTQQKEEYELNYRELNFWTHAQVNREFEINDNTDLEEILAILKLKEKLDAPIQVPKSEICEPEENEDYLIDKALLIPDYKFPDFVEKEDSSLQLDELERMILIVEQAAGFEFPNTPEHSTEEIQLSQTGFETSDPESCDESMEHTYIESVSNGVCPEIADHIGNLEANHIKVLEDSSVSTLSSSNSSATLKSGLSVHNEPKVVLLKLRDNSDEMEKTDFPKIETKPVGSLLLEKLKSLEACAKERRSTWEGEKNRLFKATLKDRFTDLERNNK